MAAAPPQDQPAQNGNVVVSSDQVMTAGTGSTLILVCKSRCANHAQIPSDLPDYTVIPEVELEYESHCTCGVRFLWSSWKEAGGTGFFAIFAPSLRPLRSRALNRKGRKERKETRSGIIPCYGVYLKLLMYM